MSTEGGAIKIDDRTVIVSNSTLSHNSVIDDGRAIDNDDETLIISNTTISHNSSAGDGGEIHIDNATLSISNSTIARNSANKNGGAIYTKLASVVTLKHVTIAKTPRLAAAESTGETMLALSTSSVAS